jgi:hypothetical protein
MPLSVLLTNHALAMRAGSETYLRDVALALLRRGHRPIAFSLIHGVVADELRRATVPVVDDLSKLGRPPDVVHGHHHLETLLAALTFPDVPIVHFCHGWIPWDEKPLRHPAIRQYVAVDEVCADRLVHEEGIPADSVETLLNFVDLRRFRPRQPLPARPGRALIFSNSATDDGYVRRIQAACTAFGIAVDVVGHLAGNAAAAPESVLPRYDIVFAKGRAALEAMAVGCAVVIADWLGCGPLVTPETFDRLRSRNFGVRELVHEHDETWYADQIRRYDIEAATAVRDRVRAEADLESAVDRLIALYERALVRAAGPGDGHRAAAEHLRLVMRPLKEASALRLRAEQLERELTLARHERDTVTQERTSLHDRIATLEANERALHDAAAHDRHEAGRRASALEGREQAAHVAAERLARELAEARQRCARLERMLAEYQGLTALRLRDAVLRLPLAGSAAHGVARLMFPSRKTP